MKRATETNGIIVVWFAVVVICVAGTLATACPNIPPEAWIDGWPYRFVLAGQVTTFNGDGYDPDGWITGYNWWIPGCSAIPGAVWSLYQRPLQVTFGTGHCSTYVYFWVQDDDGAYSETQYQRVYVLESFSMSCSQTVLAVGQPQALTLPADAVNWTQRGKVTLKVVSGADKVAIYSDSACQNRLWPPIVWAPARLLVPPEVHVKGTAPGSVQLRLDVGYAYSPTPDLTTTLDLTFIQVDIDVDSDRNGTVDGTQAEEDIEETQAAIVPVNCDDDDTANGQDNTNTIIDGQNDMFDLVPIIVREADLTGTTVILACIGPFNVLMWTDTDTNGQVELDELNYITLPYQFTTNDLSRLTNGDMTFMIEATRFLYGGETTFTISLTVDSWTDTVLVRPSPFILPPASATPKEIYVGNGYEGTLELKLEAGGYTQQEAGQLVVSSSDDWCQDNTEIGFTSWPSSEASGEHHMYVYWDLNSKWDGDNDGWIEQQMGHDKGYFKADVSTVGHFEGGTIEVSEGGFGGIVFGEGHRQLYDLSHPEYAASYGNLNNFFTAQGVQGGAAKVDTTWLSVGHVDEVLSCGAGTPDTDATKSTLDELNTSFGGTADGSGSDANELYDSDISSICPEAEQTWPGGFIEITGGTGNGQIRQIDSVDAITGIVVVTRNWTTDPNETSAYTVTPRAAYRAMFATNTSEDCGVVSGISGTTWITLKDDSKNWASSWNSGYILIVEGTGANHDPILISSSTATEIVFYYPGFDIDIGDRYVVVQGSLSLLGRKASTDPMNPTSLALTVVRALVNNWNQDSFQDQIDSAVGGFSEPGIPALCYTIIDGGFGGYNNRVFGWMPNMVNHLNAGRARIVPKPFALNGINPDPFETEVRTRYGGTVVFIDEYTDYHLQGGEIHCGTAVKREPSTWKWW